MLLVFICLFDALVYIFVIPEFVPDIIFFLDVTVNVNLLLKYVICLRDVM